MHVYLLALGERKRLLNCSPVSVGMTTSFLWSWQEFSASLLLTVKKIHSSVCVNLVPSAKAQISLRCKPTSTSSSQVGAALEDLNKLISAAINTKSWFCLSTNCLLDWTPPPWRVLLSNYCHRAVRACKENVSARNIIAYFCLSFKNECLRAG